jgi:hypothetical protein
MIEIDNTIVSLDVINTHFFCDTEACKGACCVEGDSGAPLDISEINEIQKNIHIIEKYLSEKSKKLISELGFYYTDNDNDKVTQLHHNKECVFVFFENNIAKCAIEKAYYNDKISIQKPISCHLYPIRIKQYHLFTAINYHSWDICHPARSKGKKNNIFVFEFCKDALCKKFGNNWYKKLLQAADYITNKK